MSEEGSISSVQRASGQARSPPNFGRRPSLGNITSCSQRFAVRSVGRVPVKARRPLAPIHRGWGSRLTRDGRSHSERSRVQMAERSGNDRSGLIPRTIKKQSAQPRGRLSAFCDLRKWRRPKPSPADRPRRDGGRYRRSDGPQSSIWRIVSAVQGKGVRFWG